MSDMWYGSVWIWTRGLQHWGQMPYPQGHGGSCNLYHMVTSDIAGLKFNFQPWSFFLIMMIVIIIKMVVLRVRRRLSRFSKSRRWFRNPSLEAHTQEHSEHWKFVVTAGVALCWRFLTAIKLMPHFLKSGRGQFFNNKLIQVEWASLSS